MSGSFVTTGRSTIPCRLLEALVLLQPADQLRARIFLVLIALGGTRQEHPRLDLGQRRSHDQVLARELELHFLHQIDVLHVLARNLGERDVEDVEVLPPDQVEQ
jgi:hypothetical protein